MKSFIITVIVFAILIGLAAAANAVMDTKVFHPHDGFASWPDALREFMFRRGTIPIIKIDDGWHTAQAIMFFTFGLAWYSAGRESMRQEMELFDIDQGESAAWWFAVVVFVGLLVIRAAMHGLVFESLYPIL